MQIINKKAPLIENNLLNPKLKVISLLSHSFRDILLKKVGFS